MKNFVLILLLLLGCDEDLGKTLIGNIYIQTGGIGLASYHFDSKSNVYISYANSSFILDNGSNFPSQKSFSNIDIDEDNRRFEGIIDWSYPEGTTAQGGMSKWVYEMEFSSDYLRIEGGTVRAYDINNNLQYTAYYGKDLIYTKIGL